MGNPGRPATGGDGSARPPTVADLPAGTRRGRPRSTGELPCGRCHRLVAKIRVHWPDGPVCGACFTDATHTHGTCPDCDQPERMLPGRDAQSRPVCRDCAGITTNLTCARCGSEAERFRAGACIRCTLREDLADLLKPGNDLRLHRLIDILVTTGRPESTYTYLRGARARALFEATGDRRLALTHEGFDALPRSTAAERLRALLVHHRMMPYCGNETLARFEQWTTLPLLPRRATALLRHRAQDRQVPARVRGQAQLLGRSSLRTSTVALRTPPPSAS